LGNTGIVTGIDSDNDIEVTYSSGNKWTFNPAILTVVVNNSQAEFSTSESTSSNNMSTNLEINDLVQICSDVEKIKSVQKGHGEWSEAMQPVGS